MRKRKATQSTRRVIHIVGEGLTELFYFSHLKRLLNYQCSISPRLFENNSIEKIEKKIVELLRDFEAQTRNIRLSTKKRPFTT